MTEIEKQGRIYAKAVRIITETLRDLENRASADDIATAILARLGSNNLLVWEPDEFKS